MTKKKNLLNSEEPKFVIKKRIPKEKPNFFQNIPSLRHPLARIFEFPATDEQPAEEINPNLDSQKTDDRIAKDVISGNPNEMILDSQTQTIGFPNEIILDSPIPTSGYPTTSDLDSQNSKPGNPNTENLDSLIAKPAKRISKESLILDSKIANSESLDSQKTAKKGKWEKYDSKRGRKGIFLRTDDELTKQFKQFCIAQEMDFSQGTELAWRKYMEDLDSQTYADLDSKIAVNNKQIIMMSKSKPVIINLYYQYNQFFSSRVRWTPKDDRTGQIYNHVDPRIIELEIIQTQSNLFSEGVSQSTTINGFQYYTHEIKKFMMYEEKPEILDTILKINRETWTKLIGKTIDYSLFDVKAED